MAVLDSSLSNESILADRSPPGPTTRAHPFLASHAADPAVVATEVDVPASHLLAAEVHTSAYNAGGQPEVVPRISDLAGVAVEVDASAFLRWPLPTWLIQFLPP